MTTLITKADIIADAQEIRTCTEQFSPYDLGVLAHRYRLSISTICAVLEEDGFLPSGTYERIRRHGPPLQEIMEASRP